MFPIPDDKQDRLTLLEHACLQQIFARGCIRANHRYVNRNGNEHSHGGGNLNGDLAARTRYKHAININTENEARHTRDEKN